MSPLSSSERTILRVRDIKEQAPDSKYLLLPGGLDRVIIACGAFNVIEECILAYASLEDAQSGENILFSAPVNSGYVLLDRTLCDFETVESSIRRMHDDAQAAEKLAEELHIVSGKDKDKKPGKVSFLRPQDDPDYEPEPPAAGTGMYL